MIRFITTSRLRALETARDDARRRAVQVQERADAAFAGHTRSALALTARAEAAETVDVILRAELDDAHRAMAALAADHAIEVTALSERVAELSARSLYVLLHYGEIHSIHLTARAAEQTAEDNGAAPGHWGPRSSDQTATEDPWRWVRRDVDGGRS
ncbi:hypothetical protein [Streptomyces sp. NPDC056061]|uniref:hypothetical protein n=1 Tax=Streptomyces sp. NPDC056061 TaxID=3345700 RepID=UPI0035E1393F